MKSNDNVGITFVNTLIGRGVLNGVFNLTFSAFNFTPTDDGVIDSDPVVACRLRMDKICAYQLRTALNELIEQVERAETAKIEQPEAESESAPIKGVSSKRVSPEKTH